LQFWKCEEFGSLHWLIIAIHTQTKQAPSKEGMVKITKKKKGRQANRMNE
jgi:hypothetical protein